MLNIFDAVASLVLNKKSYGHTDFQQDTIALQGTMFRNGHQIGPGQKSIEQMHKDIEAKKHRKAFVFPAKM